MKKTFFTSLVLGTALLSGCSEIGPENKVTEEQKKTPIITEQSSLNNDNSNKTQNIANDEEKKENTIGELIKKEYKNDKYNYSFTYPESWYVYDNKFMQECGPEYGNLGENEIVISRKKLNPCGAGYLDLAGWTGDVLIIVNSKDSNENYSDFPEAQLFNIGENLADKGKQGIMIPRLKDSEGPRALATIFFVESSKYNYRIDVKQKDIDGNIDPELMNILNNFSIE